MRSYNRSPGRKPGPRLPEISPALQKNLIDVSDLDPEFYLERKTRIEKSGITVIAGCGFSPGLVNLILGKELSLHPDIQEIEVKAGSLSPNKHFFPFYGALRT